MRIIFHPDFPKDIRKFAADYKEISDGLAERFNQGQIRRADVQAPRHELYSQMLRPISDSPFAKAFHLKRTANVIALHCVTSLKWILSQLRKDA